MYFFVPTVITHISSINILEPQRSSRVGMSNGFVHDWQRRDDELETMRLQGRRRVEQASILHVAGLQGEPLGSTSADSAGFRWRK